MKLSLSPSDRIGPSDLVASGGWTSPLVYGVVIPVTLLVLAGAAWYIITGETPGDLLSGLTSAPKIEMVMPARPGGERPGNSLIQPPSVDRDVKMQAEPAPAPPKTDDEASGPPKVTLPGAPAPDAPSTAAVQPPPAMSEPVIPPGGEPLTPPTFGQLPARADLKPLPPGPSNDLLRNSQNGPLPVVSGTREARSVYARPFTAEGNLPKIAIVVTGLGLSREASEAAINKLPPDVSLSFSPYTTNLDTWVKRARAAGHEVLIDLPLEPPNFPVHDAGPLSVLSRQGPVDAIAHMDAVLAKTTSYVGVAAGLRSPVASREQWAPMLRELKNRGLLFVGDGLAGAPANDTPASFAVTLVADETPFRAAIDVRLSRLAAAAQRDGAALTYVSARPVTMERLLAWIATFPQKGIALAPASAVAKLPH